MCEAKDTFNHYCPRCGEETKWTITHVIVENGIGGHLEHLFHCQGKCGSKILQHSWGAFQRVKTAEEHKMH